MNGNAYKITNWDRRAMTRVLQLMRARQEQGAIVRVDDVAEAIANRLDIMGEHGLCDMIRSAASEPQACHHELVVADTRTTAIAYRCLRCGAEVPARSNP